MNDNAQQRWRLRMLFLYGSFILGVFAIHSESNQILGFSVPNVCLIKTLFGINCPVCGITRSVLSMLHFNFSQAFLYHPLGPVIAILLILIFSYFLLTFLFREKMNVRWSREVRLFSRIDTSLVILLVGFWIVSLLF
jgi:hypothetical protein